MTQGSSQSPHQVAIIADDGSNPFELACACEVFGAKRTADLGREIYEATVVTGPPRVSMRDGLFGLVGGASLDALDAADTIVVPNRPDVHNPTNRLVLDAIGAAHARGARLIGMCTGAFTLAEAGVLHGRAATVHWQLLEEFSTRFPNIEVRPDVLFVDQGDVMTSAGGAAALDLALHVVRVDHGAEVANAVSRRLVFSGFRAGGQKQFVDRPVPSTDVGDLGVLLDWARERLDHRLTVTEMARQMHVSPATLHRRFQREIGLTPSAWLTQERVRFARRLLEETTASTEDTAHQSGLGSAANLRAVFKRVTGLSPRAYRLQFATRQGTEAATPRT
ncbi:helix-turn-helix domain-containing protein [Brevibacterium aurantiacum]|uniref:Helix-turn-helix domain-containing protein n=1 Tax=Brevibacterium aurantiacum TaxID=273384 RepID=A0A556C3T7_BREAU|nr:helix-turn-helix domain-containing protein [Brevibacterium aurantiacum]TSI12134.1 helix-turn-helix domain-containing protein [Brevibacterium aurantiacum]